MDADMDGDVVKVPIIALVCLACMAQVAICCCWKNKMLLNIGRHLNLPSRANFYWVCPSKQVFL